MDANTSHEDLARIGTARRQTLRFGRVPQNSSHENAIDLRGHRAQFDALEIEACGPRRRAVDEARGHAIVAAACGHREDAEQDKDRAGNAPGSLFYPLQPVLRTPL
jgi:hypothetical protein